MALLIFNSLRGKKGDWAKYFNSEFPNLEIREWPDIGNPKDIKYLIIGRPTLQELPHLPNLALMLTMLAGVEGIYSNPACPQGVPLVKGEPEEGDPSLTEYGITHVLRHHRNLQTYLNYQRQHHWQEIEQKTAEEQRLGLLGYGTMCKPIADMLAYMKFDVASVLELTIRKHFQKEMLHAKLEMLFASMRVLAFTNSVDIVCRMHAWDCNGISCSALQFPIS